MSISMSCIPSNLQSSSVVPPTFQNFLSGTNAFYNDPDYFNKTHRDFVKNREFPPSYICDSLSSQTQYKVVQLSKKIFSLATLGMYNLCHLVTGVMIIPASLHKNGDLTKSRLAIIEHLSTNTWKYKRISIQVDNCNIDGMIIGKAHTLANGRWILVSNENNESYERKLQEDYQLYEILTHCKSNAVVFNYPGVGFSSGYLNRETTVKAYRAMLSFLEDEKGIGAKEIIGYGFSFGAAVQGDALTTYPLQKNITYVFVKNRTFSNLSAIVSTLMGKIGGIAVKILGWNINTTDSSQKLQAPEIIIQTADIEEDHEELRDSSKIIDDGVILAEVSLAKRLLDNPVIASKKEKIFIGVKKRHSDAFKDVSFLTDKLNSLLQQEKSLLVCNETVNK